MTCQPTPTVFESIKIRKTASNSEVVEFERFCDFILPLILILQGKWPQGIKALDCIDPNETFNQVPKGY
jgi:hypothetical protein